MSCCKSRSVFSGFGVILCLSLLLLAPAPRADEWTGTLGDDVISYDDNEFARGVQITTSYDGGVLHCLWAEDAPSVRELHYGRSTDWGVTWSSAASDRVISYSDGNDLYEECDVVAFGDGGVAVVWSEDHTNTREVHFGLSFDDGDTWSCTSADQLLSDPGTVAETGVPSIAADLQGALHVVWHQMSPAGTAEVHYGRSTDNGVTWTSQSADRVISFPDGQAALDPKITATGGRLYVIWREADDSGDPRIHVGISSDGGVTWSSASADRTISPAAELMTDHEISSVGFGPENGVLVVYRASYNTSAPFYYEIYSTYTFDEGATWTGESTLTPVSYDEGAGRSASNPDVFVRDMSGAWAVWDEEDDVAGTKEQHVSHFDGPTWSGATEDVIISFPDGENGYRPSITGHHWVTAQDRDRDFPVLCVVWTEYTGGSTDNYEVHQSILDATVGAVEPSAEPQAAWARVRPSVGEGAAHLDFSLEQPGPVTLSIFDAQGRLIHESRSMLAAGSHTLTWNGRGADGRRAPAGRYTARLRAGERTIELPLIRF